MSLISASITLPSRIGGNITLTSLPYLNVVHCLALVIHGLSEWFSLKHGAILLNEAKSLLLRRT